MSTALNPLVGKIRGMHPGIYDDMDDATLTKRMLAKYPQYSDLAAPSASEAPGAPARMPMEPSHLAQALNPATSSSSAIANPQQPAEQFALDNPEQQGKLAVAAGIGAAGTGLPVAAPAIAKVAARHPMITSMVGGEAIHQARQIPGVGKYIPPMAEMLPFLIGGGKKPGAEPTYPGAPEPTATPEQLNPALSSESRTLPGMIGREVIRSSAEPIPARSRLALPPAPEAPSIANPVSDVRPVTVGPRPSQYGPPKTDFMGKVPSEAQGFDFSPAKDYGATARADVERRMGGSLPRGATEQRAPQIAKPVSSEWPPPEPTGAYDKPITAPRGISDLRDDEAVRENIRDRVGQADRKVFASHRERNDVSVPKGVLTGQIDKPVQYTKSRIAKVTSSEPVGVTTPGTDDLTPILKKSLAQARKQKASR